MQGSTVTTWDLLRTACRKAGATESNPLYLGNVSAWVDETGPWIGEVSYLPETARWNMPDFQAALTEVLR